MINIKRMYCEVQTWLIFLLKKAMGYLDTWCVGGVSWMVGGRKGTGCRCTEATELIHNDGNNSGNLNRQEDNRDARDQVREEMK